MDKYENMTKTTKRSIAAILLAIIIIMLFTCPGRKAHRETIIQTINQQQAQKAGFEPEGEAARTLMVSNEAFYNLAVHPNLTVIGYGIFSLGYITKDGVRHYVSFGMLSKVWVKDSDNIINKIPLLAEPSTSFK